MVKFDTLEVCDSSHFVIECEIPNKPYFRNLQIERVVVNKAEDVSSNLQPNYNKAIFDTFGLDDMRLNETFTFYNGTVTSLSDNTNTHIIINATTETVDMEKGLFFVFVITDGDVGPECPCGEDNMTNIAVLFDIKKLLNKAMSYTSSLANTCALNDGFIDFILNFKALKYAIMYKDFFEVINIFNRISGLSADQSSKKSCGCNG